MTCIKYLIFDLGGVLIDLDKERCFRSFDALGFDVRPYVGSFAQTGIFGRFDRGFSTKDKFCEELYEVGLSRHITTEQIKNSWNDFLVGIPEERLECLFRLKKKHPLFLLSNTNEIHWDYLKDNYFPYKGLVAEDFFENIFLSFKMHLEKPEPEMFREVILQSGVNPSETLFVDDSEINCESAQREGFHVLHAKNSGEWLTFFEKE